MELKNDILKITIKKANVQISKYVEIKEKEITYYSKEKNSTDNVWAEPKSISDEQFITKILEELYFPASADIRNYTQELEKIESRALIRPKNTARYDLIILDKDFRVELDLYITQTPKIIYNLCEDIIVMVENYLQNSFSKFEDISLDELIRINTQPDLFWEMKLKEFFKNLLSVSESEKIKFFKKLLENKEKFNEFSKEIMKNQNSNEVFNKYNI